VPVDTACSVSSDGSIALPVTAGRSAGHHPILADGIEGDDRRRDDRTEAAAQVPRAARGTPASPRKKEVRCD